MPIQDPQRIGHEWRRRHRAKASLTVSIKDPDSFFALEDAHLYTRLTWGIKGWGQGPAEPPCQPLFPLSSVAQREHGYLLTTSSRLPPSHLGQPGELTLGDSLFLTGGGPLGLTPRYQPFREGPSAAVEQHPEAGVGTAGFHEVRLQRGDWGSPIPQIR